MPESGWLPALGKFYDMIIDTFERKSKGKIVKFLGDGALIVFSGDDAADAINAAIVFMEHLKDVRNQETLKIFASVGISSGSAIKFSHYEDSEDYVGRVVDLAARLCNLAMSQAIFVDTTTVTYGNMGKVSSRVGLEEEPRRTAKDYLGQKHEDDGNGISKIEFHSIHWAQDRFDGTQIGKQSPEHRGEKPPVVEPEEPAEDPEPAGTEEVPSWTPPESQEESYTEEQAMSDVAKLWNNGQRKQAVILSKQLVQAGSMAGADQLFSIASVLANEGEAAGDARRLRAADGLLNFLREKVNHRDAAIRLSKLRQKFHY